VSRGRYFDLSTLLVLGLATLLFISLPGGCSDNGDDTEDVEIESTEEPTPPPMMEIVEPEPGVIGPSESPAGEPQDSQDEETPASDDAGDGDQEPVEEEASDGMTYVVQSGDTLYGIAVNFNVGVDALMEENGITDPNSLQIGQILQIPSQN
jgi:LysM repeat protein